MFHLWCLSGNKKLLAIISPDDIYPYIPTNNLAGEWESAKIPLENRMDQCIVGQSIPLFVSCVPFWAAYWFSSAPFFVISVLTYVNLHEDLSCNTISCIFESNITTTLEPFKDR